MLRLASLARGCSLLLLGDTSAALAVDRVCARPHGGVPCAVTHLKVRSLANFSNLVKNKCALRYSTTDLLYFFSGARKIILYRFTTTVHVERPF